jgi:hypothetical protein
MNDDDQQPGYTVQSGAVVVGIIILLLAITGYGQDSGVEGCYEERIGPNTEIYCE